MNIKASVYVVENPQNKILGTASITLDECFVVKGLRIMENNNGGKFVSMPNRKVNEEYKDIAFPITKELREQIQKAVLDEFNKKANNNTNNISTSSNSDFPF